jgi:2-keto-3-deoxy-L-rhamnonate aldolase RhmA
MGKLRNRFRERLARPEPMVGAYLSFPSPDVVEFLGHVGFDWVFFDGEHGGIGVETAYTLVRAADAVELPTMLRVPVNDPTQVLLYAETGVDAIMVPHVQDARDAERFVRALRYWPDGHRGAMASSRAANFGLTQSPREYFSDPDGQPLAVALLEDQNGCENASAIAKTPGLDIHFLGPGDLAMSIGLPAQTDHPDVQDLLWSTCGTLVGLQCTVGTLVANPDAARKAFDAGMRMVVVSAGLLLSTQARSFLAEARA